MVLKRKFFTSLLIPLLVIAALLFTVSYFALQKEIKVAEQATRTLMKGAEKEKRQDLALLLSSAVTSSRQEIESLLLLIQKSSLQEEEPLRLLMQMGTLSSIDFVQYATPQRVITFLPKKVIAHPIEQFVQLKGGAFVEIETKLYFALSVAEGSYLLFDWEKLSDEEQALLEKASVEKKEVEKESPLLLFSPFYLQGLKLGEKKVYPVGIGIEEEKQRVGYLAEDFLFCDIPVGTQPFVSDSEMNLYVVEHATLRENAMFALGFSLNEKLRRVALLSDDYLFLAFPEGSQIGFTPEGKKCNDPLLLSDQKIDLLSFSLGENGKLSFFSERTMEERPLLPFLMMSQHLFKVLVWGLFFALFIFILFALLLFWYLSGIVLRPLDVLAAAQAKVAEGKYEEMEIMEVAKRKDEIGRLATTFLAMVESLKEREKIRSILNKVVSKEVAEEILKEPVHLGGEDRIVTMLFADIRDFTRMIVHFPPQKVVQLLNGFMTKMTRVIEGEGGVIDKYVGDQIMALFGAPAFHPDHAIRSLASAKLMIETLKKWNVERELIHEPLLGIGIGIHTGLVVAGNMGTEDRLNYTVIGADVSLAARLCQAAKPGQILISEFTLNEPHVKDSFIVKELDPISVKGFDELVKVFEVSGFKWEAGE